jgi:hypothetical protein
MDYPNIAKVFDAGSTETGRPFFVMELVRGIPITQYCDQNNLATKDRLELFIKVCQAIQHAHQKGIIHRDVKPSNILVTLHDGVPMPKVIDFGIAKATQQQLTDKTVYTQLQQFIGTPAYMSPEQAEMSGLDIDTRSDIYSLGVLLYELLIGRTPFDPTELVSQGIDAMRKTIREKEPVRPSTKLATLPCEDLTTTAKHRSADSSKLLHQLRGDLDWIAMKCLEKDRTRRYETANGLASDIRRHLNCEPVMAGPKSRLYEFQRTVRRHKFGFGAATGLIALLAVGFVISTWMFSKEKQARQQAVTAEQEQIRLRLMAQALQHEADQARLEAEQNAYAADISTAHSLVKGGEAARARELLGRYAETNRQSIRGFEWGYLLATARSAAQDAHAAADIAPMPHPHWLLTDGRSVVREIYARNEYHAQILQIAGSNVVSDLTLPSDQVHGWDLSRDGRWLAVVTPQSEIELWNLKTGAREATAEIAFLGQPIFSIDGRRVFIVGWVSAKSYDGRVEIWDLPGMTLRAMLTNAPRVTHLVGDTLIGRGDDRTVTIHRISDGALVARLEGHSGPVVSLDASWDGRYLATPSTDGTVRIWTLPGGQLVHTLMAQQLGNNIVQFSPDGRTLATAGTDGSVTLWSLATGRRFLTLRGPAGPLDELLFSADGRTLAAYGGDKRLTLWRADDY